MWRLPSTALLVVVKVRRITISTAGRFLLHKTDLFVQEACLIVLLFAAVTVPLSCVRCLVFTILCAAARPTMEFPTLLEESE
jgi:hypothetical protein